MKNLLRGLRSILEYLRLEITAALVPTCDEQQLRSTVWYIESRFRNADLQQGTGVVIRVTDGKSTKNVMLSCQHVVYSRAKDEQATSIRCWQHESGYNPDCADEGRTWQATPLQHNGRIVCGGDDFANVGSNDWILLEIHKQNHSLDALPFALGLSTVKTLIRQRLNAYRLLGYPGGQSTMQRDIVRATVSRDFRLADTDAKPGTKSLQGPEDTAPGVSGGPYFTADGQIVAIHRGVLGKKPIAVDATTIQTTLQDLGWTVVQRQQQTKTWLIRLIAMSLLALGVLFLWQNAKAEPITLYCIEGVKLTHEFDTTNVELVGESSSKEEDRGPIATIGDGVLNFKSGTLEDYESEFIAIHKLNYRHRLLGLPLPTGTITIKIRKHEIFDNIEQLFERLSPLTDMQKQAWYSNPANKPVLSIRSIVLPATVPEPELTISQDDDTITFRRKINDGLKVELNVDVGHYSPSESRFPYKDTRQRSFHIRYVMINSNKERSPIFDGPAPKGKEWKIHLQHALTIDELREAEQDD